MEEAGLKNLRNEDKNSWGKKSGRGEGNGKKQIKETNIRRKEKKENSGEKGNEEWQAEEESMWKKRKSKKYENMKETVEKK